MVQFETEELQGGARGPSVSRDATIDVLRGLAIFLMIPANLAATLYAEPHSFWFRVVGSLAAPLFILLAGYMVGANAAAGKHGLGYFALRGAMLLVVAALIDVGVWRIAPFMTYDVLYLIGLALPVTYAVGRIRSSGLRWALVAAIIGLTPVLQYYVLGYTDYPTEIYLVPSEQIAPPANPTNVLHHLLVDGWFPVFPWLAFALLGGNLAGLRRGPGGAAQRGKVGAWVGTGVALLVVGVGAWWWQPGQQLTRAGYSELFYEPTVGFVLAVVGAIMLLFWLVDLKPGVAAYQPLRVLGEAALLMYITHLVLVQYVLGKLWPGQRQGKFLIISTVTTVAVMVVGWSIRQLKQRWQRRPMVVRFALGG